MLGGLILNEGTGQPKSVKSFEANGWRKPGALSPKLGEFDSVDRMPIQGLERVGRSVYCGLAVRQRQPCSEIWRGVGFIKWASCFSALAHVRVFTPQLRLIEPRPVVEIATA